MAMAQSELSDLIAKTVQEQTFSLDGVKAIEAIRAKAETLEKNLSAAEKTNRDKDTRINDLSIQIADWSAKESRMREREGAVAAREAKIAELEKQAAIASAQFTTLDSIFTRIFANRQVREQTLTSVPVAQQHAGGGGSFVSNFDTRNTIDRTEG